jgi:hypothetical protein
LPDSKAEIGPIAATASVVAVSRSIARHPQRILIDVQRMPTCWNNL